MDHNVQLLWTQLFWFVSPPRRSSAQLYRQCNATPHSQIGSPTTIIIIPYYANKQHKTSNKRHTVKATNYVANNSDAFSAHMLDYYTCIEIIQLFICSFSRRRATQSIVHCIRNVSLYDHKLPVIFARELLSFTF